MNIEKWLDESVKTTPKWYGHYYKKVVASSRIRIARNFKDFRFPHKVSVIEKKRIYEKVFEIFKKDNIFVIELWKLSNRQYRILMERHHVNNYPVEGSYLLIFKDQNLSILLNDEDHIRFQIFTNGKNYIKAKLKLFKLCREVEEKFKYAYDKNLGYLTTCPSNISTGLRISFMVHIPALFLNNDLDKVSSAANECNLVFRGLFGEGTKTIGGFCQISNQKTFGVIDDIIDKTDNFLESLISYEWFARERIVRYNKEYLVKILSNERERIESMMKKKYSIGDIFKTISILKFGYDIGLQAEYDDKVLGKYFFSLRKGHKDYLNNKRKYKDR